jgi:hypothetical protein
MSGCTIPDAANTMMTSPTMLSPSNAYAAMNAPIAGAADDALNTFAGSCITLNIG